MPIATVAECPKDVFWEDDLIGWIKRPEQKIEHAKQVCDEMWNRSSGASVKTDKKCVARWAVNVRAQYEPAKRAIRFFRWHHRPRLENAAARFFYQEAATWKDDTMHWSSVTKMIAHPSYLRIIGLAREFKHGEIEELILKELENEPDHWFEALVAITGENPVHPQDDFDGAVNAWLAWGHKKGFLG
jgi:hypothetical protein